MYVILTSAVILNYLENYMSIKLADYFTSTPYTFDKLTASLEDNELVYYLDKNTGKTTIRKLHKQECGNFYVIGVYNSVTKYTSSGRPINTTKQRVLFPIKQDIYDSLVVLYGIDNVEPMPVYMTHVSYIVNQLKTGKMPLCVVMNNISGCYVYSVTLITSYSSDTNMYMSFDGELYDKAVPIDTKGNIIYVSEPDDNGVV